MSSSKEYLKNVEDTLFRIAVARQFTESLCYSPYRHLTDADERTIASETLSLLDSETREALVGYPEYDQVLTKVSDRLMQLMRVWDAIESV